MMGAIEDIRKEFPELSETVYGKPLVYLDNAATSQRPLSVVRKWDEMSLKINSNLHRAVHKKANDATFEYESARKAVCEYLGASDPSEIVFTSGATASLNLVAFSFGEEFVKEGDEIIVSEAEHHSNIVPWQMMAARKHAVIKVLTVDENGRLEIEKLPSLINERTRLVCVAHISNVLGLVNPIGKIVEISHQKSCPVLVDGAQGIVHENVNVSQLGCDFYVFSGHKLYGPPGTGVLYARKPWLDRLPPYMGGGEMIETVKWEGTNYAAAPHKFEAGTQNISGVPALKEALKIDKILKDNKIRQYSESVRDYVYEALVSDPSVHLFGRSDRMEEKAPLFSFCVEGAHHEDLALILDKMGVAVRSGQMCAEPLMDRFGVTGMLRASFAPYNTMEEAEFFIDSLHRAAKMLKG